MEYQNNYQDQIVDASSELKKKNANYLRIIENVKDLIFQISLPDGKYKYISPTSVDIFGYEPMEFYTNPDLLKDVMHPDFRDYFNREWRSLLTDKTSVTYEYKIVHKSGDTRWLTQRSILVRNDNGEIIGLEGIISDITERKKAEKHLINTLKELKRSNKKLEQYTYAVFCDIQEPLQKVKKVTELFSKKYAGKIDDKADLYLKHMIDGTKRMQNMILKLLGFSKVTSKSRNLEKVM